MSRRTNTELADICDSLYRTATLNLQPHEREALFEVVTQLREPEGVRVEGTATYEGDEWRFEEGGLVGDPKAILIVYER